MDKDKFYVDGPICFRKHEPLRYKSTGQCYHCMRQRYQENKDAHRESMRRNYFEMGGREVRQERDKSNRPKLREQKKQWSKLNEEKVRKHRRDSYYRNRDKALASCKAYRSTEAGRLSRKSEAANAAKKYPWLKSMRAMLRDSIRRGGMSKTGRTEEKLGYSYDKFNQRIEMNFQPGMSWENYGKWHIDHTKPVARFIEQGITDIKLINCLSNLRPMWATENIKKGAKWQSTK